MRGSSRLRALGLGVPFAIVVLAVPTVVLAANFTVTAIPGAGWVQAPDNTAGMAAVIVDGPAGGLGTGSVELTTEATGDFTGIARQVLGPLSDLTGAAWRTYATGDTGNVNVEPASLRFSMFRLGGTSEFTTLTVELVYNGGATADAWQQNTLAGSTMVWQTNTAGAFCLPAAPCTFDAFKDQYPDAVLLGLTVAIGTGLPPNTTYVDGISMTVDGVTDTWNFEPAAAPTPRPTPRPTSRPQPTTPPTDADALVPASPSIDGRAFIVLGAFISIALLASRRPSRRAR